MVAAPLNPNGVIAQVVSMKTTSRFGCELRYRIACSCVLFGALKHSSGVPMQFKLIVKILKRTGTDGLFVGLELDIQNTEVCAPLNPGLNAN